MSDFLNPPSFLDQPDFLNQPGFLDGEVQAVNETAEQGKNAHTELKIAVALGVAFIVWRTIMKRKLRAMQPQSIDEAYAFANLVWGQVAPAWLKMATPAVAAAYGMATDTAPLSEDQLNWIASEYAQSLGGYLEQTSSQALIEGYTAQITQNVEKSVAWSRVTEAYGLDPHQMQSTVKQVLTGNFDYPSRILPESTVANIAKILQQRAERVGKHEAWAAMEMGKSIVWMQKQSMGLIPEDAMKQWITADDELVCMYCGPLHEQMVPLPDKFTTDSGTYWAPSLHINCRCELKLVIPEEVEKSLGTDLYDRDMHGRFSPKELRIKVADPFAKPNPFQVTTNPFVVNQFAPALAPVIAPVVTSVAAPVIAPVAAPVVAPVVTPVAAPVIAPVVAPAIAPPIIPTRPTLPSASGNEFNGVNNTAFIPFGRAKTGGKFWGRTYPATEAFDTSPTGIEELFKSGKVPDELKDVIASEIRFYKDEQLAKTGSKVKGLKGYKKLKTLPVEAQENLTSTEQAELAEQGLEDTTNIYEPEEMTLDSYFPQIVVAKDFRGVKFPTGNNVKTDDSYKIVSINDINIPKSQMEAVYLRARGDADIRWIGGLPNTELTPYPVQDMHPELFTENPWSMFGQVRIVTVTRDKH